MRDEYVLAIETSCDETAVTVGEIDTEARTLQILHNIVASQVSAHQEYGGVVPFLAARLHTKKLPPLVIEALRDARDQDETCTLTELAVTNGPGLEPALYTGVNQANVMGVSLNVPVFGINHLHGHIWSYLVPAEGNTVCLQEHAFPFLALIVSGGHTALVLVRDFGVYEVLGQTIDDAGGEAFDKVASMLELGYPGGPAVSKRAAHGNPEAIDFPRPMREKPGFDVSFSGLKTSVLYELQGRGGVKSLTEADVNDVCASFQRAVIDTLLGKVKRAIKTYAVQKLVLGGGVAANPELRLALEHIAAERDLPLEMPVSRVTGDNALMIATVAGLQRVHGYRGAATVAVDPNASIEEGVRSQRE